MGEFDASSMFDPDGGDWQGADTWEVPDDTQIPEQPPAPAAQANAPRPKEAPMYEPEQDDTSAQWGPYDNTQFIPPQDDFAPEPAGAPAPPPGRQYGMSRQPPTWQHASLSGVGNAGYYGTQVSLGGVVQGLMAIAGGALLGYGLTGNWKAAAGGGVGMIGLLQLPTILEGHLIRPLVGAGCLAGSYFLLRDDLQGFEGAFQPNDGDDDWDDDEGDEWEDEPEDDPSESSPWMKES